MKQSLVIGVLLAVGTALIVIKHQALTTKQIQIWKALSSSAAAGDTSSLMSQLLTMISKIQTRLMGKSLDRTAPIDPNKVHVQLLEDIVDKVEHDPETGLYLARCTALSALIRLTSPKHIKLLPMVLIEDLACFTEDRRKALENLMYLESFFKLMPGHSAELARLLLDPIAEKDPVGLARHIHYELTGIINI